LLNFLHERQSNKHIRPTFRFKQYRDKAGQLCAARGLTPKKTAGIPDHLDSDAETGGEDQSQSLTHKESGNNLRTGVSFQGMSKKAKGKQRANTEILSDEDSQSEEGSSNSGKESHPRQSQPRFTVVKAPLTDAELSSASPVEVGKPQRAKYLRALCSNSEYRSALKVVLSQKVSQQCVMFQYWLC
jgi:hypothetical protein